LLNTQTCLLIVLVRSLRETRMKTIIALLFMATVAQAAQVTLTWDLNTEPDLTGYKVYFGNYSGNTSVFPSTGQSQLILAPPYTVTGLDPLKKWFFRVTALAPGQESLYSNMVNVNFIKSPGRMQFIKIDVR
jgi:chitinase